MSWEWIPAVAVIIWMIGMWVTYIIIIGVEARTIFNKQVTPLRREDAIEEAKRDFWAPDNMAPMTVFFWPVTALILFGIGVKNLFGWWTDFFIKRLT